MPEEAKQEIRVAYYALLREQAGKSGEVRLTSARTARQLYHELSNEYGFSLAPEQLAVSVNEELCDWNTVMLKPNDKVVFIPPVAGG